MFFFFVWLVFCWREGSLSDAQKETPPQNSRTLTRLPLGVFQGLSGQRLAFRMRVDKSVRAALKTSPPPPSVHANLLCIPRRAGARCGKERRWRRSRGPSALAQVLAGDGPGAVLGQDQSSPSFLSQVGAGMGAGKFLGDEDGGGPIPGCLGLGSSILTPCHPPAHSPSPGFFFN